MPKKSGCATSWRRNAAGASNFFLRICPSSIRCVTILFVPCSALVRIQMFNALASLQTVSGSAPSQSWCARSSQFLVRGILIGLKQDVSAQIELFFGLLKNTMKKHEFRHRLCNTREPLLPIVHDLIEYCRKLYSFHYLTTE